MLKKPLHFSNDVFNSYCSQILPVMNRLTPSAALLAKLLCVTCVLVVGSLRAADS